MSLDERKRKILQAVVQDYIITAEPVGSRSIAKKYIQDLSSATIRNEMADLEEMGYLMQPHTSAGRIPSDLGYRIFVDNMLERYKLTIAEMIQVHDALNAKIQEAEKIVSDISSVLAHLTDYAAVAMTRSVKKSCVEAIQAMYIDKKKLVVVLVIRDGSVRNRLMITDDEWSVETVQALSNGLNAGLSGLDIDGIQNFDKNKIKSVIVIFDSTLNNIFEFVLESLFESDKNNVIVDGSINLLKLPEYSNIDKAKEILEFMNDKENLYSLVSLPDSNNDIQVIIGHENPLTQFQDCSIIMCSYSLGGIAGNIGLVGPKRMDYAKTVSMLEYLKNELGHLLN